jgi:hypothetical protein
METFNLNDFEEKFLEYIEQNIELFERRSKELTERVILLKVKVEKCEEMSEIIVKEFDSTDFYYIEKKIYTISGRDNADFKIFNASIQNQLIIDMHHAPFLYESYSEIPLCFTRITQECISEKSIYLIGSYYIKASITKNDKYKSILILTIGKDLKNPDEKYTLKLNNSNKIIFKNNDYDFIILGRSSLNNVIYFSEPIISRIHAKISFNSFWKIEDTSKFGFWEALHTSETLLQKSDSNNLSIINNTKVKFNGVILSFSSTYLN